MKKETVKNGVGLVRSKKLHVLDRGYHCLDNVCFTMMKLFLIKILFGLKQ